MIDQRQARDIARSNFDLAMRRYGEGVGSTSTPLSVQQQLLVAERQLASLESQQIDLSVQLVQALGGGLTRFPLRCARYRESAGRMNEAPTMTTANSETPPATRSASAGC